MGKAKRHFYQVRLSTVLILMGLAAMLLAGHYQIVKPYYDQKQAVAALRAAGDVKTELSSSWIYRNLDLSSATEFTCTDNDVEAALLTQVAKLYDLQILNLPVDKVNDEVAFGIGKLHALEDLSIASGTVTNKGLASIGYCKKLKTLNLSDTLVSDAGLQHLASLQHLEELKLPFGVSGHGLGALVALPKLRKLDLSKSSVTFNMLHHLAGSSVEELRLPSLNAAPGSVWQGLTGLKNLATISTTLNHRFVNVTDEDVRCLVECKRLVDLNLSGHKLTNAAVKLLAGLTNLKSLSLHGDLTDDCFADIAKMKSLKQFNAQGRFRPHAVATLRRERPDLAVNCSSLDLKSGATSSTQALVVWHGLVRRETKIGESGPTLEFLRNDEVSIRWPARIYDLTSSIEDEPDRYIDVLESRTLNLLAPTNSLIYRQDFDFAWSLKGIETLKNLKWLNIQGRIAEEDLKSLERLPQLTELTIQTPQFTVHDLRKLSLPKTLRKIELSADLATADAHRFRAANPEIQLVVGAGKYTNNRSLSLAVNRGDKELRIRRKLHTDLSPLRDLQSPVAIQFEPSESSPLMTFETGGHTLDQVTQMQFARNAINNAQMRSLVQFPNLEQLSFQRSRVTDEGFSVIGRLEKLKRLEITCLKLPPNSDVRPTICDLSFLSSAKRLERLDLTGQSAIDTRTLEALQNLKHLNRLALTNVELTEDDCACLSRIASLRDLSLLDVSVADEALEQLARSKSIEVLTLSSPLITENGLRSIARCSSLRGLQLGMPDGQLSIKQLDSFRQSRDDVKLRVFKVLSGHATPPASVWTSSSFKSQPKPAR